MRQRLARYWQALRAEGLGWTLPVLLTTLLASAFVAVVVLPANFALLEHGQRAEAHVERVWTETRRVNEVNRQHVTHVYFVNVTWTDAAGRRRQADYVPIGATAFALLQNKPELMAGDAPSAEKPLAAGTVPIRFDPADPLRAPILELDRPRLENERKVGYFAILAFAAVLIFMFWGVMRGVKI